MDDLSFTPIPRKSPPPTKRRQFNLKRPLLVILMAAVVMASLHWSSDFWNSAALTTMLGALCAAVPITLLKRRELKPFWIGFTTIGWLYTTMIFGPWFSEYVGGQLLTVKMVNHLADWAEPCWRKHGAPGDERPRSDELHIYDPPTPFRVGAFPGSFEENSVTTAHPFGPPVWASRANFYRICHFWCVLALACTAGVISRRACSESKNQIGAVQVDTTVSGTA
jgi:hypothetical protein